MRLPAPSLLLILSALSVLSLLSSWIELILYWLQSPEFGHGLFLCGIAFYMLWQSRNSWASQSGGFLVGGGLLILGFSCHFIGILGDIQVAKFYSLILVLAACPILIHGPQGIKGRIFPYILMAIAIPLHPSLNSQLTTSLQLISSDIGVWFIRAMGMAALQDGNVIDMGNFVMLVEEACSGLRYLLPLLSINLLAAYYYKGNYALKAFLVFLAVPITVFMNSLRIALTGVIIKYYGPAAAQGFLHDFEGIVVFAGACSMMLLFVAIISLIRGTGLSLDKNFDFSPSQSTAGPLPTLATRRLWGAVAILCVGGTLNAATEFNKTEVIPERKTFSEFPLAVDDRLLYPDILDDKFLDILLPDDYFIGDFVADDRPPINLYMAYYESQRNGSLIHSPRQCIPAGGWNIVDTVEIDLQPLGLFGKANRSIIEKDQTKLLVYYWVNQQGVNFADEGGVYFSLIKRSVLYSRTDGTLVRVIVPYPANASENAEQELRQFILSLNNVFPQFLPK